MTSRRSAPTALQSLPWQRRNERPLTREVKLRLVALLSLAAGGGGIIWANLVNAPKPALLAFGGVLLMSVCAQGVLFVNMLRRAGPP